MTGYKLMTKTIMYIQGLGGHLEYLDFHKDARFASFRFVKSRPNSIILDHKTWLWPGLSTVRNRIVVRHSSLNGTVKSQLFTNNYTIHMELFGPVFMILKWRSLYAGQPIVDLSRNFISFLYIAFSFANWLLAIFKVFFVRHTIKKLPTFGISNGFKIKKI